MNNIDFFNLIASHPETLLDKAYAAANDILIIPTNAHQSNSLTQANAKLIRYISTFHTLTQDLHLTRTDTQVQKLLTEIMRVLEVKNIHFSAFCQYFMVHNLSFSIYKDLAEDDKRDFLFYVLEAYITKRHDVYLSYGYSDIVLQTLCDNYSHKRKGMAGIRKIEQQLVGLGFSHAKKYKELGSKTYLFPDKKDKKLFKDILTKKNISFVFRDAKQGKNPDILFIVGSEIYIVEHKTMKESGGGQDKQVVEVLDFIRQQDSNPQVHYITYMDGIFVNKLVHASHDKSKVQLEQATEILKKNPRNYFVNTFAFEKLLNHLLQKPSKK